MKNSFLFLFCLSVCSCGNFLENSMIEEELCTRESCILDNNSSADSMLNFPSEQAYSLLLDSLMNCSHEELEMWGEAHGIQSLYSLHTQVLEDISKVSTIEEYDSIRSMFEDVLIFNTRESNDYSVYLPVRNASQAVTLNHNGEVRIAGQIRKIHDITLEDISSFGEDIMTFSEGNVNIENGINTVHVLANHRKFNASYLITEMRFSARKRFLGGWISYTTEFFIQAPNGPEQSLGEHKSPFICQLPLNDGTKIYLWSRGVGSENKALMTISK